MSSVDDLMTGILPQTFVGNQSKTKPSKSLPTPVPPPPSRDGDTVADAADPDDPYEEQAKSRENARQDAPLVPVKSRNMLQVNVSGRMRQLIEGEITVEDLDDQELMTGSFRDQSGKMTGNRSKLIPKAMHQEIMRRILQRGQERIRSDYFDALDVVSEIMVDSNNDPNVRLRAASMVIDRIAGKTPEKVELSVEVKKYEEVATTIFREIPEDYEDAEVVEDDN